MIPRATEGGLILLRQRYRSATVAWLNKRIECRYREIDRIRLAAGPAAVAQTLDPGARFAPTASSLNLQAAFGDDEQDVVLAVLADSFVGPLLRRALGARLVIDLDEVWVRRQYAPARYPALHAPHGWHQDGALHFDFLALGGADPPRDGLLNMLTCWIALTPCGTNAPGLELIAREVSELLPPAALSDRFLRKRYPADAFTRPVLAAGDALLFPGGTIHRTHVTPCMQHDRTSLELRFMRADSIPRRLQNDRFVTLDQD